MLIGWMDIQAAVKPADKLLKLWMNLFYTGNMSLRRHIWSIHPKA